MKIIASVLLAPSENTLGSLRNFLEEIKSFNVSENTELLDGGHIALDEHSPLMDSHPCTIEGLSLWLTQYEDLPDDTVVNYATELCVEPTVVKSGKISCGSHAGPFPDNIIITVNPACESC